jgi:hypothetical protein
VIEVDLTLPPFLMAALVQLRDSCLPVPLICLMGEIHQFLYFNMLEMKVEFNYSREEEYNI